MGRRFVNVEDAGDADAVVEVVEDVEDAGIVVMTFAVIKEDLCLVGKLKQIALKVVFPSEGVN